MTEVIVYRNPLEAAMWNSLMNGGLVFVLVFMVAALIGVFAYSKASQSKMLRLREMSGAIGIGTCVAILLIMHFLYMYLG